MGWECCLVSLAYLTGTQCIASNRQKSPPESSIPCLAAGTYCAAPQYISLHQLLVRQVCQRGMGHLSIGSSCCCSLVPSLLMCSTTHTYVRESTARLYYHNPHMDFWAPATKAGFGPIWWAGRNCGRCIQCDLIGNCVCTSGCTLAVLSGCTLAV
jgi:hypothetical protein